MVTGIFFRIFQPSKGAAAQVWLSCVAIQGSRYLGTIALRQHLLCFTAGLCLDSVPKGKLRTTASGWVLENSELMAKTRQFPAKQDPLGMHRMPVAFFLLKFCQCSCVIKCATARARASGRKIVQACVIKIKRWQCSYPGAVTVHPRCSVASMKQKQEKGNPQIPNPALSPQCAGRGEVASSRASSSESCCWLLQDT